MKKAIFTLALAICAITACANRPSASVITEEPEKTTPATVLDLQMNDPEGVERHLTELIVPGHYTLLDFWATWCPPCRQALPGIKAAYEKYHDRGFDVIGVSLDKDREAWLNGIKTLAGGLPWKHISDLKAWQSQATQVYGLRYIPRTFLVDPEGKIIADDIHGEELEAKLAELLSK